MGKQWEAVGPDAFGDFHIRAKGEELAKCVVVQNGFNSPEETKQISERLIKSVNAFPDLVKALQEVIKRDSRVSDGGMGYDLGPCAIIAKRVLADVGGASE